MARGPKRNEDSDVSHLRLRMTKDLRALVDSAAEKSGRTSTAEIIHRIETHEHLTRAHAIATGDPEVAKLNKVVAVIAAWCDSYAKRVPAKDAGIMEPLLREALAAYFKDLHHGESYIDDKTSKFETDADRNRQRFPTIQNAGEHFARRALRLDQPSTDIAIESVREVEATRWEYDHALKAKEKTKTENLKSHFHDAVDRAEMFLEIEATNLPKTLLAQLRKRLDQAAK